MRDFPTANNKLVATAPTATSRREAPVEADQDLIEIATDFCGRADRTQVREEEGLVLGEDVVPLNPQRPVGRDHPLAADANIEAVLPPVRAGKLHAGRVLDREVGAIGAPPELAVQQERRRDDVAEPTRKCPKPPQFGVKGIRRSALSVPLREILRGLTRL